ncbi:hypothetical protein KP509_05G055000 [Ceratopteris richardii]|uniref:BTB domain-containing protein n=1 Tax=Ceratopteris richardii TaxID=49495 RepID=A0A8T2UYE2_CERRI|nr:hypothetical protein KP509_05G055000 [Ceratopteris richardii]
MGDLSLSSARASSSSPALAVSSSPFSTGNTCSAEAGHSSVCNPETPLPAESFFLRKLSSNLYGLISTEIDDSFSDVLFYVSGSVIPLHRCILAARSPFFKTLFSKDSSYLRSFAPEKQATTEDTKLKIDFDRLLSTLKKVGGVSYGAFMATIGFLYSGQRVTTEVKCIDDHCLHEACRPVIDFAVEMLGLSSVLDVTDLKNYWEDFLQNVLEKAQVDDILPILVAAKTLGHEQLLLSSQNSVAVSNMSTIDIQKQLPMPLSEEVLLLRCKMGLLQPETLNPTHERQCQRIWKALDSHDIELVQLLLKEGKVTLDGANALHYAVAYCDTHLVNAVLQLGLSDLNARNNRGFTVLHVAAMRLDPSIVLRLLFSGANHLETTPDGRTALQLSSRLIRRLNNDSSIEIESLQKGRICVEILYQAGTNNLVDVPASPLPANDEELYERLLYLENRGNICLGSP